MTPQFVLSEVVQSISVIKNASIFSIVTQALLGLLVEILWSRDDTVGYADQDIRLFQALGSITLIVLAINIFYIWIGSSTQDEIVEKSMKIWVEIFAAVSFVLNVLLMSILFFQSIIFYDVAQREDKDANTDRAVISLLFLVPSVATFISQASYGQVIKEAMIVA